MEAWELGCSGGLGMKLWWTPGNEAVMEAWDTRLWWRPGNEAVMEAWEQGSEGLGTRLCARIRHTYVPPLCPSPPQYPLNTKDHTYVPLLFICSPQHTHTHIHTHTHTHTHTHLHTTTTPRYDHTCTNNQQTMHPLSLSQ